jgi:uncharacterized membrane protein YphA (DoxX/SURF4 family)
VRLLSTFPDGPFGVGLFLLRASTGSIATAIGLASLFVGSAQTIPRIAGAVVVFAGAALVAGVVTPIAGGSIALLTGAMAISWLPSPVSSVLDDPLSLGFLTVIAIAIVLLGPGAYSIDARLFGRREILIPTRD